MDKKIKLIVKILIVILVIVLILIYMVSRKQSDKEKEQGATQETLDMIQKEQELYEKIQADPSIVINGKKTEVVKAEGVYLTLENMIKKYNSQLNRGKAEAIYSLLYDKYIEENGINISNVLEKTIKYSDYKIEEIRGVATTTYGIYYAKINSSNSKNILLINWDIENNTFSICPTNEQEYNVGKQEGISVDKERIKSIEKNNYNKVTIQKADNDTIAQKYFYDFIDIMVNNTAEAYEKLDTKYKEINFKTYEDFLEYVKNNKERLQSLDRNNYKDVEDFENYIEYENYYQKMSTNKMKEYSMQNENGVKTYTFLDTYGEYYIFKVEAAMKYTVILDNYTIPTDEFTSEYKNQTDAKKVVLNIKRFFMGIDDKNYGYSYSVLSESFKTNKYPTKEEFVAYANKNFFEENEIEYITYKKENGGYIYKIKIKDATGKSKEEKTLNIIMKLKTGTDFEMSFGE